MKMVWHNSVAYAYALCVGHLNFACLPRARGFLAFLRLRCVWLLFFVLYLLTPLLLLPSLLLLYLSYCVAFYVRYLVPLYLPYLLPF